MRLAIDARPALDARRTGVGHYTRELIRRLPEADPDSSYVAWYLHFRGLLRPRRFFADVEAPNLAERASRFPARIFQPLSFRAGVPRLEWLLGFDALLATNFLPPPTRSTGVVLVVHDLAFERFPETAPHVDGRWRRRFDEALRSSAAVIVPSVATRTDLLAAHPIDEARVRTIPHGVDADEARATTADAVESVRKRLRLPERYVLFVGGIEPRKNLPRLVRAFAGLRTDAALVIAGGRVRWYPGAADELRTLVESQPSSVRERIVLAGYVAESDKRALFGGATVLAYPSLYEGFGFPVLEGMAARVPVLTSDTSSLPDVAGDAALLVDPTDEAAIAGGISSLLDDEDLRDRLISGGLARAATFTWHETARRTAAVLREAAARR